MLCPDASWTKVLILIFIFCFLDARAQDFRFLQGIDQPAMQPLLEDNNMVRGLLLEMDKTVKNNMLSVQKPVPDTLVDPNGNLVDDARIKILNRTKQRMREEKLLEKEIGVDNVGSVSILTWILAVIGCGSVVGCGILPAFIFRLDGDIFIRSPAGRRRLNCLLSFATGSLLGDVFFHLLPEVWSQNEADMLSIGLWTLAGVLSCFFIEKCCSTTVESQKKVCAIMNLCANIADNFAHGLAVGASFLICPKLGLLTTFAIVIHELPHEISDFAILLRGNFTLWSAIKAQLLTATGGIIGACIALYTHAAFANCSATNRMLAFTAGSFINIGLCQILPDLLKETDSRQSLLQLLLLLAGTFTMNFLNNF